MKSFKEIHNSKIKTIISSDNFTNILETSHYTLGELKDKRIKCLKDIENLQDRHNRAPNDETINEIIKGIRIYVDNIDKEIKEYNIKESEEIVKTKISVEDDFLDDGILALYKIGSDKYDLEFEVANEEEILGYLYGTDVNLIKFLLDIVEMTYEQIEKKYPKLNFKEYDKEENNNG